jgi:hypothetical protein
MGTQDCGLFKCAGNVCGTTCTSSAQCIATARCDAGKCVARGSDGDPCKQDDECVNGHCADGVCCNTACAGRCEACDVANKLGVCSTLASGDKPHGTRAPCENAGAECGGRCDGVTAAKCVFANEAQTCGKATCTSGVAHQPVCDGQGGCTKTRDTECAKFACGETACKTTCSADTDCGAQFRCDTGTHDCVPANAKCDGDHTLTSPEAPSKDCTPYKCSSANVCLNTCTSRADCVAGMTCTTDGKCQPAAQSEAAAESGCGCAVPGAARHPWPALLMAALGELCIAIRRARRRD